MVWLQDDDALKQLCSLFSRPLSLRDLRQLKKNSCLIGSRGQSFPQQRCSLFQTPVFTVKPAEKGERIEVVCRDLELLLEHLHGKFAVACQQVGVSQGGV